MARNQALSDSELQKILLSEEFFEDFKFQNNAEIEDNVEELSDVTPERIVAEINCPPQEIDDICHSVSLVDNNHEFAPNNVSINSSQSEIIEKEEPNILNSHDGEIRAETKRSDFVGNNNFQYATEKSNEYCESIPMMLCRKVKIVSLLKAS
jgi:hypothetical protein